MTYDVRDLAKYVIDYSIETKNPVSNLKLQKLLYYIQAAFLVERGEPAFTETISAWKYGPVIECVYHDYKIFSNKPIDKTSITGRFLLDMPEFQLDPTIIKDADKEIIDKVIDSYKDDSAMKLVTKTHAESPWRESGLYIDDGKIERYYSQNPELIYGGKEN